MNYDFLENIPSSLTQIPTYSPDFGFLSTMQGKANQQYEAGLSQVKSEYGSIFSQPVTGVAMQQRQQEYAKQAQQRMKDISASDLSDPKNVQAAEQVMAPFHEDTLLMKNIGLTASYQAERSKLNTMRNSKDADQRALYNNPILDRYINQGIEELASAPLTGEVYNQLGPKEIVPIHDVLAEGDKSYKETYGTKGIENSDAEGSVTKITINGPQSFSQYKTYMAAFQQRPEYAAQNRLIATTLMNDDLKDFKQRPENVGIPDDVLHRRFTENVIEQNKMGYAKGITDARKASMEWRMKNSTLIAVDAHGNITGDMTAVPRDIAPQIIANVQKAKEYEKMASDLEGMFTQQLGYKAPENSEYIVDPQQLLTGFTNDNPQYQKTLQDALYHGSDYYQKVYQDQVANQWAAARASISSVEYKENPAYKTAQEQANKEWQQNYLMASLLLKQQQGDRKLDIATAEEYRKMGLPIPDDLIEGGINDTPFGDAGYTGSSFSATSGFNKGVQPNVASGIPSEPGTSIEKVPTHEVFKRDLTSIRNAAFSKALSYQGNLQLFSAQNIPGGLSSVQLMDIAGQMNQAFTTGKYPGDATSVANRKQFLTLLKDQGIITGNPDDYLNEGPGTMADYSEKLAIKYANDIPNDAKPEKRQLAMRIMESQQERDNLLAEHQRLNDAYKTKLTEFLRNNNTRGQYSKLINPATITKDNPTGELYTASDMAKDFPRVTLQDGKGNYKILEPLEFADMYQKGQVLYHGTQLFLGDNPKDQMKSGSGITSPGSTAWNIVAVGNKKPSDYMYGKDVINDFNNYYSKEFPDKYVNHWTSTKGVIENHKMINPNSIVGKYGESQDIPKLLSAVGNQVIAKIPGYNTGASNSVVTYNMATEPGNKDLNIAQQRATGIKMAQEIFSNPNNIQAVYTIGSDGKKKNDIMADNDLMSTLRNHSDREAIAELYGTAEYDPVGPNGKPAVKFTTRLDKSGEKDRAVIGDEKVNKLKGLGPIWVDLPDNPKGEVLSQLPHPSELLRYGRVYYDKEGVSNSTYEEQSGFRWHIVPDVTSKDPSGRYTRAYVVTQKQKVDQKTGMLVTDKNGGIVWADETSTPIPDLTVYNPDMLKNKIDNWVLATMQENDLRRASHQATPQTSNTMDITNYVK